MKKCSVCDKTVYCRQFCRKHYLAYLKYGDPLLAGEVTLAPCGTRSAYNRHLRRKEPTCQPCRDAQNKYVAEAVKKDSYRARKQQYNLRRHISLHGLTEEEQEISVSYRIAIINDPCYYCGEKTRRMQTDHKMPISRGGTDVWWNLCRACFSCNRRKGTLTEEEFRSL